MKIESTTLILILILILFISLFIGCIEKEESYFFKTSEFRIGDKIKYELQGKMIFETEKGFLIYYSTGEMNIEIKKANIEDGFGNNFNVIDFYIKSKEMPYNYTGGKKKEDLPINIEKHIYRIYEENDKEIIVGKILKSITIHHALNRERYMEINSYPINDFIDYFLQREFYEGIKENFSYEKIKFMLTCQYDKNLKAIKIDIKNESIKLSIWIKNGYPLPYQIVFKKQGIRNNTYSFLLKEYKKGHGKKMRMGNVYYESKRNLKYEKWKDFMSPSQGNNSKMKIYLRDAVVMALSYKGLKDFMKRNLNVYLVYAEYWEGKNSAGWILHFGNNKLRKDYVLNVSKNREPIPSMEISPYLAYEEIPKDFENLSDKLMNVSSAENIFKNFIDYDFRNFSFKLSYIEVYYPDSLFDLWEGNGKDKEIVQIDLYPKARGACLIDGFYKITKEYAFGYRLSRQYGPFIVFDGKINGMNGMVTYIYKEY